jgi:hypothetical protein
MVRTKKLLKMKVKKKLKNLGRIFWGSEIVFLGLAVLVLE